MIEFRKGDKVRLTGIVDQIHADGSITLRRANARGRAAALYKGAEDDLELIERPKTPGQIAYEAYLQFYGVSGFAWDELGERARKGYDAIAQAVKDA